MNSSGLWILKALPSGTQEMIELSSASLSAFSRRLYNLDGNVGRSLHDEFLRSALKAFPFPCLP
jgi:hypothetical protein